MLNNQRMSASPSRVKHVTFAQEGVQGNNAAPQDPAYGVNRFESQIMDQGNLPRLPLDIDLQKGAAGNGYGAAPAQGGFSNQQGYPNQQGNFNQQGFPNQQGNFNQQGYPNQQGPAVGNQNNGYQIPLIPNPYKNEAQNNSNAPNQNFGQQGMNGNMAGPNFRQDNLQLPVQGGYGRGNPAVSQQGQSLNVSQRPYFESQNPNNLSKNFFNTQQVVQPRKFSSEERYLIKKVLANVVNFLDEDAKEARDVFGKYDTQKVNSISIRDME